MRLIHSSKIKRTLAWFTVYSLYISLFGPLALARESGSPLADQWQHHLFIQSQRNGPRPKPGAPEGEFPNLNEIRQRNHPDPQAPEHVPSIIRSKRNPLVPWDGRRVGEEQVGTSVHNNQRDLISRVTVSTQGSKKIHTSHHARPGLIRARLIAPPLPDDQYVQNFFYWALLRYPNGTETIYWNDIFRAAYANGQGSLVLATRELGKTLFESSEYGARNRDNQWYVFDLYKTFLMRNPDSGWAFWESAVATSGRENVRRAFEDCTELSNLLATITPNGSISSAVSSLLAARNDPSNQPGNGMLARDATWSIPLLSLPGRSGLDLGLALSYSSMVWTRSGPYMYFDEDNGFPSPGFRLGFPTVQRRLFDAQVGTNAYLLITSAGSRVELRRVGTSNIYEATDSSYLQLTDNGSSLLLRSTDGTQLNYVEFNNEYRCTQIKDRNGNYLTVNYNGLGQITTMTDTLARVITFNYDGNANLLSISQSWNGQTHNWATFGWGTRTMQSSFSGLSVVGAANGMLIPVITQVGLHDGSYFTVDYTDSLQTSIVRRYTSDQVQRSSTAFDYNGAVSECPRLIATRVSAHNWTGLNGVPAEVVTQYGVEGAACVMTAPDGTIYKEFYGSGWQKGLTTLSEVWSGGIRQKWTTTSWARDNTSSANDPLNPRPTETNVYDAAGNRRRTTFEYHPSFGLPSVVTEYAEDSATVLRRTCFDYKTEMVYIDRRIIGLLFRHTVYDGNWNLMAKTEYGYDWNWSGDMFQDTAAPATQHDRTNYGPSFIVGRGNLSQVARFDVNDPNNASNTWQEMKWRVNSTGSVLMERDHLWHQSFISYGDSFSDGNNGRNTFAYPTTITDGGGFTSYVQYNFDFGARTRVQGPPPLNQSQGIIQTFSYDNAVRLSQTTTVNNGAYTRHVYGPNYIQSYATVNNVADEAYSVQMFDGAGRVTAAATNHPGSTGGYSAVHSIYNAMGRLIKRSNPTEVLWDWSPFGDDAAGWLYTQQTYDWQGRPRITTNTDGTTKEVSYGGCGCAGGSVITLTDEGTIDGGVAKRRQQKIYSDVLGRTVKSEVLNWQGGSVYSATVNTYNVRDQVTLIRQFQGNAPSDPNDLSCPTGTCQQTVMTYDGRGRLKTKHVPEQNAGTATTWDYNSDDTVQKITDARGASQTFSYNSRHLVIGITYNAPPGITSPAAVSFGYDAAGNRTSMTDGTGNIAYNYNQLSQITSETRTFSILSGHSYTTTYGYTLSGQVKYLIDPAGSRVDYVYDNAMRITSVTGSGAHSAPSYASNVKYRAWGAVKDIDFGNATHQWVNYNARLLPINMELRNTYVPPSNPSVTMRWNYDYYADGRINHAYDVADDRLDRKQDYDHVGRLKDAYSGREARGLTPTNPADSAFRQSFDYNAFSNMTSRTGRFWRQMQLPESATYTNDRRGGWSYDANGNVLTDNSHENTFDAAGRQTFTQGPWNGCGRSYDIEQQYDGNGRVARRVETYRNEDYVGDPPQMSCTTTGGTTYYVNASALGGLKLIEVNASGAKVKGYVYANGQRLAVQAVAPGVHSVSFYHANPGTSSWAETSSDRYAFRREMGPLGEELGTFDPYIMLESPSYTDVHSGPVFLDGGDPFDFGSGCGTIDGLPASCSELRMRLEAGTLEAFYPGRRERAPNQRAGDPNPTTWVPVRRPIENLGLGIYVILMPTLLHSVESDFGSVSFSIPQEPLEKLLQLGKDELEKRIKERKRCAEAFGGQEKALKALNQLRFSPGSLDNDRIMEIEGNKVTVDPNRFNEGGQPLPLALNIKKSNVQGHPSTTYTLMHLVLTGKEFAAFAVAHELGHKRKIYGEYDKDGSSAISRLESGANNEKIRDACFDEFAPQLPSPR
jgi:YD repeat-containing protein